VKLNGCTNVTINNYAVGNANSEIDIYLSDVDTSGSLKLRKYKKNYETQKVSMIKLDDYCEKNCPQKIHFIKADVEGAELEVLKGAENMLRQSMPILFLEIQQHHTQLFNYEPFEIFDYLYGLGYHSYIIQEKKLEKFSFHEPLPTHNFFFFRPQDIRLQNID
jgi:FkbM family methyltransferase